MSLLILLGFLLFCFIALKYPLVGFGLYYFTALLKPELIWPHLFGGMRLNLYAAAVTLLSLAFCILKKSPNEAYKPTETFSLFGVKALILIAIFVNISYFVPNSLFSEYSNSELGLKAYIVAFNSMVFFSILLISYVRTQKRFTALIVIFLLVELIMVYWSNSTFLYHGYNAFTSDGRLPGPNGQDENIYAARLLIGLPFLMYAHALTKNKKLKLVAFSTIPFYWHAIFLTGSRGGMIALAIVTLLFAYKIESKKVGFSIAISFVILAISQAAPMVQRIESALRSVDKTYIEESDPRFESWSAGMRMIADNAIFGVGFERFQQAASSYGYNKHYVAHNTFIQFAANSGLIPAITYLFFGISAFFFVTNKEFPPTSNTRKLALASAISLLGLFICSFFLNLVLYEMTYFVIALFSISKSLVTHENHKEL